ncbi:helix-hairpin-helix domain-containing protein [candidate division WOR-3 bacterium]|nr:helix-hairpin-helix domain-containing protein [candidate division WOR-3 bacterium]
MESLSKDELALLCCLLIVFSIGIFGLMIREKRKSRLEFISEHENGSSAFIFLQEKTAFLQEICFRDTIVDSSCLPVDTVLTSVMSGEQESIPEARENQSAPLATVNINSSDARMLETLPGIGPVIAQRIIDYRNEHGPFSRKQDIQNVRGIGPAKYSKIESLITL